MCESDRNKRSAPPLTGHDVLQAGQRDTSFHSHSNPSIMCFFLLNVVGLSKLSPPSKKTKSQLLLVTFIGINFNFFLLIFFYKIFYIINYLLCSINNSVNSKRRIN